MRPPSKRLWKRRRVPAIPASGSNGWQSVIRSLRELRDVAFQALTRSHAQLMIVGGVTALEKVGFFLSLDGRSSSEGCATRLALRRR